MLGYPVLSKIGIFSCVRYWVLWISYLGHGMSMAWLIKNYMLWYDATCLVLKNQSMTQFETKYQHAWLSMDDRGMLWYDGTWSVIMKQHMTQVKTQYPHAWLSMDDICFGMMVYGQSSWNNIWPKSKPNTHKSDWVWMIEVCFDTMVHGQSSWNKIWPKSKPNTHMRDWVWMIGHMLWHDGIGSVIMKQHIN